MIPAGAAPADSEPESLLRRTAKGAGWIIGWRMLNRGLGVVSTLCLVRLLQPGDFGLVTLAMGFAQAIEAVSSLGVEDAVIREKQPSRELYDSAFTINLTRGLATGAVVALAAAPVAAFFEDARLLPVMLVVAAGAVVMAMENIGIVDFRRNIAFDQEFILFALPRLVSTVVAVGLGFAWQSYWALVWGIQVGIALRTAMGYVMHPFRPRLGLRAWRQIAGFSFWSWLLSLGSLVNERGPSFIIGRLFNLTDVGVFAIGAEIASLPTTELIEPLHRACFAGFASARAPHGDELHETASMFLRLLGGTALLTLPAGFGLSLIAHPLVQLAVGPKWEGAAAVIEVLGVALTVTILGFISGALMNAHARLKTMFAIQLASIGARFALVVVLAMPFGLVGAAIGVGLSTAFEHVMTLMVTVRYLQLRRLDVLRVIWRSLTGALVMALGLWAMGLGWARVSGDDWVIARQIAVAIPVGGVLYAAVVAATWLASGRPAGAERDMFGLLCRALQRG
jgi:O-antigen/teichoic acid export membrane protein